MEGKRKVGRPKLADKKLKKNAIITIIICFILVVTLIFGGILTFTNNKLSKLNGKMPAPGDYTPPTTRKTTKKTTTTKITKKTTKKKKKKTTKKNKKTKKKTKKKKKKKKKNKKKKTTAKANIIDDKYLTWDEQLYTRLKNRFNKTKASEYVNILMYGTSIGVGKCSDIIVDGYSDKTGCCYANSDGTCKYRKSYRRLPFMKQIADFYGMKLDNRSKSAGVGFIHLQKPLTDIL